VDGHTASRRGFVDEVDGFVGQAAFGNVTMGKSYCSLQGVVGEPNLMEGFVPLTNAS